jgi:hypothetical protein
MLDECIASAIRDGDVAGLLLEEDIIRIAAAAGKALRRKAAATLRRAFACNSKFHVRLSHALPSSHSSAFVGLSANVINPLFGFVSARCDDVLTSFILNAKRGCSPLTLWSSLGIGRWPYPAQRAFRQATAATSDHCRARWWSRLRLRARDAVAAGRVWQLRLARCE